MELPIILLTLGGLFLLGLAADLIGRHSIVPRVTLLMLGGLAVGEAGLGIIPSEADGWYDFLSVTALTMVAFLLGASLSGERLRENGRAILGISAVIVVVTTAFVAGVLLLMGFDPVLAVLLGAIATATDPAATIDAMRNSGVANRFTETVEGIVAIDDAWGLIVFGLALTVAHALNGVAGSEAIGIAVWEIGGAIVLGLVVGLPAAYATGRITAGEPLRAEALAIVFLTAGAALWLEVSFLIAGMTAGAVIVNMARHHERSFHEIERMEWPFMLLFFVLAGASLEPAALMAAGTIGAVYCLSRAASRLAGGWLGAVVSGALPRNRALYGPALMPQAGVAVGMALVAAREFPQHGEVILTVAIASTVVFELIGPFGTRWAALRSAESARERA